MKPKRVTSLDVARRAGVSRTTVSLVLNNVTDSRIRPETMQRVIEAAHDLGYIAGENAARAIGFVISRQENPLSCDIYLSQLVYGLFEIAQAADMRLILEMDARRTLVLAHSNSVEGLVLAGARLDEQALQALHEESFPFVVLERLTGSPFPSVYADENQAARRLVEHLIEAGHSRIACITPLPGVAYQFPGASSDERLLGYWQALEAAGLSRSELLVRFGSVSPETGYTQMSDLLELDEPPTAVFATSDIIALGALSLLQQDGLRVPQDVALAGFDDIPLAAYAVPPLTTARVPAADLAREAGRLLLQLMRGEQPAERQRLLPVNPIFRQSTGA